MRRTISIWALGYGGLQTYWAVGSFPGRGVDLVIFSGWPAVALCVTALVAAWLPGRAKVIGAWAAAAALAASSPMLLLDVVFGMLPGLGLPFDPWGFLSRALAVTGAVLLAVAGTAERRRLRGACVRCGGGVRLARMPRWGYVMAYMAIAGFTARVVAQAVVGFDNVPLGGGTVMVIFAVGYVLAGTVLPLALAHGWPRFLPRWLVLGPAFALTAAMTVYFGITMIQIVAATMRGTTAMGELQISFFWAAVAAYLVWAAGLGGAAVARLRVDRPECPACGAAPPVTTPAVAMGH